MKLFYLLIIIILSFKEITSVTDLDKTEKSNCMSIAPSKPEDCYNNKNYTFNSLACCFFQMEAPSYGNICVAMPMSARGDYGNITTTLPVRIKLSGFYSCGSTNIILSWVIILLSISLVFF